MQRGHLGVCALVFAFCACAPASEHPADAPPISDTTAAVVGGQHESRFAAVGYLLIGPAPSTLSGPDCGATLISARVAVTAAHCIVLSGEKAFGIGFGDVGSSVPHPAKAVIVHPAYNSAASERYRHDVAVLVLSDAVTGVTPAAIATAQNGERTLYIGYGRTTAGDDSQTTGYTNERKSTFMTVSTTDAENVWATGDGGGLCWGDSGGPILDESTGALVGVLADFDKTFDCHIDNKMIFTSLGGERPFIDAVVACADAVDPAACLH